MTSPVALSRWRDDGWGAVAVIPWQDQNRSRSAAVRKRTAAIGSLEVAQPRRHAAVPERPAEASGGLGGARCMRFVRVDQAGRADAAGAEPGAGLVDRALGVAPAEGLVVQGELALLLLGRLQALDPDADQPDPAALQPQRLVQGDRRWRRPRGRRPWPGAACGRG